MTNFMFFNDEFYLADMPPSQKNKPIHEGKSTGNAALGFCNLFCQDAIIYP